MKHPSVVAALAGALALGMSRSASAAPSPPVAASGAPAAVLSFETGLQRLLDEAEHRFAAEERGPEPRASGATVTVYRLGFAIDGAGECRLTVDDRPGIGSIVECEAYAGTDRDAANRTYESLSTALSSFARERFSAVSESSYDDVAPDVKKHAIETTYAAVHGSVARIRDVERTAADGTLSEAVHLVVEAEP